MQRKKEINGGDVRLWKRALEFDLCISELYFSGSYALIQVFYFGSTNFTWFNSIIKYKNLSTNKYVSFNKTFSLYLTKLFIIKRMATFIQPSISPTQYTETKIL